MVLNLELFLISLNLVDQRPITYTVKRPNRMHIS